MLVTHLSDVVRRNAGSLLSRQDVQQLIDGLRMSAPALLEDIGADGVSLAEIHAILRALLDDMVPIRDLIRILEAVTARARDTRDREQLVEAARQVLAAAISAQAAPEGVLAAITIEPSLEQQLIQARRIGESGSFLDLDASRMEQLIRGDSRRSRRRTAPRASSGVDLLTATASGHAAPRRPGRPLPACSVL